MPTTPTLPSLLSIPSFKIYVICAVLLSFQMLVLGFITAKRRADNNKYLNPEDKSVALKDATLVEGAEHPDVARVMRAHRNMLETLPLFFALGLIAVLVGVSPLGAEICFGVFTVARVIHSIVYIKGVQPWRTMFFGIAGLSLIALMVQILLAVFR